MLSTARNIYLAIKDEAAVVAAMRVEYLALAQAVAIGDGAGLIVTNATVNGQSFGAEVTQTKEQRLQLIGAVIKMVDNSGVISSTVRGVF